MALVGKWKGMLQRLTQFSKSQPHAAYSAFTHGLRHKFARKEYSTSVLVTRGFVDAMRTSNSIIDGDKMFGLKSTMERQEKYLRRIMEQRVEDYSARRELLIKELSTDVARIFRQLTEPSASNWLSCLPLEKYGFVFHKSDFRDCVRLRFGKELDHMPDKCACRAKFDINHALNCHLGGFINIRHNEIRNFIGWMISRVQNDVQMNQSHNRCTTNNSILLVL